VAGELLTGTVAFDKDLQGTLKSLDDKIRAKCLKLALAAGVPVMTEAMRAAAPKETGALQASIGSNQKQYRKAGLHVATIGARRGMTFEATIQERDEKGKQRTRQVKRDPARYIHLADLQTGFIRAAFESAQATALAQSMGVLAEQVEAALKEVAPRGGAT
jgi:hypothetical protein